MAQRKSFFEMQGIDGELNFEHVQVFHSLSLGYALHRMIYDNQGQPIDYLFIDINEPFTRMTGLSRDSVIGKKIREILPGIEDFWIKKYGRVATTGEPDSFENFSSDLGKKFRVSAFCPHKGYFGVLFDDITPLETLSKKVLQAENKYQRLFGVSNDGILIINRQGIIYDANERFCNYIDQSKPRLIGESLWNLVPEDERTLMQKSLYILFEEGTLQTEVKIIKPNGEILIFELLASVYDSRAELAIANLRDITQRKKTEAEAAEYHQRVEAIFNQSAVGIVYLGLNFKITECNRRFAEIVEYEKEELMGKSLESLIPVDDRAFLHPTFALLPLSENNNAFQHRLLTRQGEVKYINRVISQVMDSSGKPAYYIMFVEDLTAQKLAEDNYVKQQKLYTGLLDDFSELLVRWKPDGSILYSNRAYKNLYGDSGDVGYNIYSRLKEEDRKRIKDKVNQLTPENPIILDKHVSQGKNGPEWHLWSDRGIFDESGQLIEIHSIGLNISEVERLSTEALLQQTFFEELFNNSPYGLVFLDAENRILRVNKSFTGIFGYTFEEASGHYISQLIVPEDKYGEWSEIIEKVIDNQGIFVETKRKKKDGTLIDVRLTGRPVRLKDQLVGIFGIYEDITLQKQNQRHLERHARLIELILSITQSPSMDCKNMLRKTLEESLLLLGGDLGLIFEYHPHIMEVTIHAQTENWQEECTLQKNIHSIFNQPNNLIIKALNENQPIILNSETDDSLIKTICPGSSMKSLLMIPVSSEGHFSAALILGSFNEKAYGNYHLREGALLMDAVWRTVEQQRLVSELKKALSKAEESEKLKSSFLATMSHELRTPLNAIIGFASLIDENMAIEEILDCIRTIQASGTHLLNLINDMFHLSALEADQLTLSNETVSISRVFNDIKDLVLSYQQVENKQHLEIRYIPDPSMYDLKIVTDYQKLVEILINLIKNSIKFTEKGYVKYGWVAYEDKVTFFVKDTGIGIPEEKRDIIFQKFRQGDESSTRKYGGAGIGLTLVKALTEIMEGRVYFESEPGAGTTFFVELPCLPEDTANKPVCKKYEALTTAEIIVVEDEETNYYLIESILRKYKTRLIHFKDGETALKYIEEGGQPNIILMDIRLPGIDGLEITRRIKALKPNIPIIAQTAYAMSGDRERALSAGCDDYISKPFKRQQLLDLIIQYLH